MSWLGPAISAGATIAGAALSGGKSNRITWNERLRANSQSRAARLELWRDAAQEAPALGIHPLYALGAQPSYSPALAVGGSSRSGIGAGLAQAGQDIGNAISRNQDTQTKRMTEANIRLLEEKANTETAMQSYYASEAARRHAENNHSKGVGSGSLVTSDGRKVNVENMADYHDSTVINKDQQISSASTFPSSTAGTHAAMKEYVNPLTGGKIMLPYSEEGPAEAMQSIPIWAWPGVIEANKKRYGKNWKSGLLDSYAAPVTRIFKDQKRKTRIYTPAEVYKRNFKSGSSRRLSR